MCPPSAARVRRYGCALTQVARLPRGRNTATQLNTMTITHAVGDYNRGTSRDGRHTTHDSGNIAGHLSKSAAGHSIINIPGAADDDTISLDTNSIIGIASNIATPTDATIIANAITTGYTLSNTIDRATPRGTPARSCASATRTAIPSCPLAAS